MKTSNNLFSPIRAIISLLAVGVILAGIAACSSVTDYSGEEVSTIPEEALSGEIAPEDPVKSVVVVPPVRPQVLIPPVRPRVSGNIDLKGEGSISVSTNLAKPLFIVDGKEYTDFELSDIEPKQIESIEVLKGAAAKAIYGAQAKDGAVIVTKKDEDGE